MMWRAFLKISHFIVLAGMLFLTACAGGTSKEAPTPTPLPTPIAAAKQTFKVQRGDITAQIQFTARVVPAVQEDLYFRASGRVRTMYVGSGDTVTKGQVLADLTQLNQMEAQQRSQDLNLRRAEINYEMALLRQQLWATRTPAWDPSYEINKQLQAYEVELAQIAYEETRLNVQNLQSAIEDAQILSPIDGRVLDIAVFEGKEVQAFQVVITVGDDTNLEIGAALTNLQMQSLAEGMPAVITLPNRPGSRLSGVLHSLPYPFGSGGSKATTNPTTGSRSDNSTRITLDNPADAKDFRLGDMVDVSVVMESKQGVLWLPPSAIRAFEGRDFVVVQTDSLPRRTDVSLGIQNEEKVEIIEGLEEGQVVIAP